MTIKINVQATGQEQLARLSNQVTELGVRSETLTQKLGKQLLTSQSLENANAKLASANATLSNSYTSLNAKVGVLGTEMGILQKELTSTNAALQANIASSNAATASNNKNTASVLNLSAAQRALHDSARGAAGAAGMLWTTYGQIIPLMASFAAASAAMKIFNTGSEFEYLNTFSSALSEGQIGVEALNKSLLSMKGVAQTPTELAKGFLELQKAGVKAEDSIQQLNTTAKYAAVGQLELGAATEQLATITAAFAKTSKGASGDILTVADTADVVAFATQKSTASFSDMQVAFRYMTGTAATAGFSIQEVASALMIMANHGLKGSMGATSLRTAFERLINPTEKASKLFIEAGGNMKAIYDDGKFKGIQSISSELERLKGILSAKAWSKFSFTTFGLRGMQVNALVGDMASLDTQLKNVAQSSGFVDKTFSQLAETTKFKMKELAVSFENAFIKAFEGEKAREVIGDLQRIISGDGFSKFLEDIASGSYNIAKGLASAADQFYKLPTTVAEVGIVSAVLFGLKGKAVLAGMVLMSDAINNINWALKNSVDITFKSSSELADYRKDTEVFGDKYAEMAEKVRKSKEKISSSSNFKEVQEETKVLNYLEEQLYNLSAAKKSDASASVISSEATKAETVAFIEADKFKKKIGKDFGLSESEQHKLDIIKAGQEKLRSLGEQFSTYQENKDNESLAKKLVNLEKQYNANEALITKEKGSNDLRAQNKKDYEDKVALLESTSAAENERRLQEDLVKLETTENQAYDRRIAAAATYHAKREAEILKTTSPGEVRDKSLAANNDVRAKAEIDALKKLGEEQTKVTLAVEKFNDALAKMGDEANLGGISDLEKALKAIDIQMKATLRDLKDTKGLGADDYEKAAEAAKVLGEKLKEIQRAKLGNDPLAGFVQGLKDANREVKTLGSEFYKLGQDLTGTFKTTVANTFADIGMHIIKDDWPNKFSGQMDTISSKIKDMQYKSIEGGAEQLEYLRKEYDTTLASAMKGNEKAFNDYMSNLDTYLAKAKEEMSPEEYAKVYAQTMADLNALNTEYAAQTTGIWATIKTAWDGMLDEMLAKFLATLGTMVAEWAAKAVFNMVISQSGSATGAGFSAAGAATSAAASAAVGAAAEWVGSFWADGGYIDSHPKGGKINQGSGAKDDVYLGTTGITANYGMGGEYIVNKKATEKFLPLLEEINTKEYASGGTYGNNKRIYERFDQLANSMHSAGYTASDINAELYRLSTASQVATRSLDRYTDSIADSAQMSTSSASSVSTAGAEIDAAMDKMAAEVSAAVASVSTSAEVATHAVMRDDGIVAAINDILGYAVEKTAVAAVSSITGSPMIGQALNQLAEMVGFDFSKMVTGFIDSFTGVETSISMTSAGFAALAGDVFGTVASFAEMDAAVAEHTANVDMASLSASELDAAMAEMSAAIGVSIDGLSSLSGFADTAAASLSNTTAAEAATLGLSVDAAVASDLSSAAAAAAADRAEAAASAASNSASSAAASANSGGFDSGYSEGFSGYAGDLSGNGTDSSGDVGGSTSGGHSGTAGGDVGAGNHGMAKGGLLTSGSWMRDDIYLGHNNYAKGGEYIINPESTAAYLPVIEEINRGTYVEPTAGVSDALLNDLKVIMLAVAKNSKRTSDALLRIEQLGFLTN